MAVCSDLNKYFTFLSMPFHMSESGIRKRDLSHRALGSVTCSIAAVEEKQTLAGNSQFGCRLQGVIKHILKVSISVQDLQRQTYLQSAIQIERVRQN